MPKHLQAAVKECRELLEQDFACQLPEATPSVVKDAALAFFLKLAVIRCIEEQIWKTPPRLTPLSDYTHSLRQIIIVQKRLCSELSFLSPKKSSHDIFPLMNTLKTILYHLITTIRPEEWQREHILGWLYQYFYEETPEQKQHDNAHTDGYLQRSGYKRFIARRII